MFGCALRGRHVVSGGDGELVIGDDDDDDDGDGVRLGIGFGEA